MKTNPLPTRHSTFTHLPWVKYSFHKFPGGQIESLIKLTGEEGAKHFPFLTRPHTCHLCCRQCMEVVKLPQLWRAPSRAMKVPRAGTQCPQVIHVGKHWKRWACAHEGQRSYFSVGGEHRWCIQILVQAHGKRWCPHSMGLWMRNQKSHVGRRSGLQ